jgi:hypothetical protein
MCYKHCTTFGAPRLRINRESISIVASDQTVAGANTMNGLAAAADYTATVGNCYVKQQ